MKLLRHAPLAVLWLSMSVQAASPQPGLFVGLALGGTQADFVNVDSASSMVISVGHHFSASRWGVEASVLDVSEAGVDDSPLSLSLEGLRTMLVFNSNVDTNTPMNIFLKGGIYRLDTRLSGNTGSSLSEDSRTSSGFVYSMGMEFYLSPHLAVGGELTSHTDVDYVESKTDATFLGVCGRWLF